MTTSRLCNVSTAPSDDAMPLRRSARAEGAKRATPQASSIGMRLTLLEFNYNPKLPAYDIADLRAKAVEPCRFVYGVSDLAE